MNTLINKPFKAALLFSIGVHAVLLSPMSGLVNRPHEKQDTHMEVTYIEIEEEELIKEIIAREAPEVTLKKEMPAPAKIEKETDTEEAPPQEEIRKEATKQKETSKKEIKKIFSENEVLDLNAISHLKGTSDSLNYLKDIRDKISRYVHRKYSAGMGKGNVVLHFVLNYNGSVRSARVIRETTGENRVLKDLCLDSIYNSSPFRRFPSELDLNHAAFKIHISFKRK